MSSHIFHEIFLHLNWHVKDSRPMLVPALEEQTHDYLRVRIRKTRGVYLHEIGGTENHVHLAIQIEPFVTISELVGQLKGASAHDVNQLQRSKQLEWQRGYGVVSFGRRQLPWIKDYVRNQKAHHAKNSVVDRLERITMDDDDFPWIDA